MAEKSGTGGPPEYSRWIGFGIEIAASMLVPVFAGHWADKYFEIRPYGVLSGAFVGFISIFWNLYKLTIEKK